jgi:peptidoglycan hydrolase CwlO-like protein
MDNEILEILKQIQKDQQETNSRLDRIENKLDGVHEQTADLTEFRTETKQGIESIQKDIDKLTNVTKDNCFEIANLKVVK